MNYQDPATLARSLLATNQRVSTANYVSSKLAHDIVETLAANQVELHYTKSDGTITILQATLNSDIAESHGAVNVRPTAERVSDCHAIIINNGVDEAKISIFCTERREWRTIFISKIYALGQQIHYLQLCGETATPEEKHSYVSPGAFHLSLAQQTAIFFWISGTVHKVLVAAGKSKDVQISIHQTGNSTTITEKNSGLSLDL